MAGGEYPRCGHVVSPLASVAAIGMQPRFARVSRVRVGQTYPWVWQRSADNSAVGDSGWVDTRASGKKAPLRCYGSGIPCLAAAATPFCFAWKPCRTNATCLAAL